MKNFIVFCVLMLQAASLFAADRKVEITFTQEEYDVLQAKTTELEFEGVKDYLKALVEKMISTGKDMPMRHPMMRLMDPVSPAVKVKQEAARAAWLMEAARLAEEEALRPKPAGAPTPAPTPTFGGRPGMVFPPRGPFATPEEREQAMDEWRSKRFGGR